MSSRRPQRDPFTPGLPVTTTGWPPKPDSHNGAFCASALSMLAGDLATPRRRLADMVRLRGRAPAVVLAAWFVLVAVASGAWRNVPLIDDWTYAWTVEQLLNKGTFEILDWSSAYPLIPALWGAAWSAVLGFSFVSLRISTLVLGIVGCRALYLMLRELGAAPRMALLGALSLAVNPVFVFLSSSFMTDVPFIAFTTLALLSYVRAARRGELRFVWWAGAWSFAAFLVRQVGIVTPVAGLPLLLLRPGQSSMTRLRVALSLAVTWSVMGLTLIVMRQTLGTTSVMDRWTWNLLVQPASYLGMNGPWLVQVSFYMLPALLAAASLHGLWRRPLALAGVALATAVLLLVTLGEIPLPLLADQTWTLHDVGETRALVAGRLLTPDPVWLTILVRAAGLLTTTLLIVLLFGRRGPVWAAVDVVRAALREAGATRFARRFLDRRSGHAWLERLSEDIDQRRASLIRAPLLAYLSVYFVLINLLWMWKDRYSLVVIPALVALTLSTRRGPVAYPRLASIALVLFAVTALLTTRGAIRFNEEVRDAWQSLIDAGVPASDIDAGYAWNGWVLYAHPANLAPGLTPLRDVPFVTSDRKTAYVISKAPLEGYVVERELSWRGLPWSGPDRLFVLRQMPTGPANSVASPALGTPP